MSYRGKERHKSLILESTGANLAGVTATTAEINILDGVTATAAEINLLDGAGAAVASGTQATVIADVAITYSANDPSITPDGAVTISDGSAPSVAELLELIVELKANQEALIDAVQAFGIVATS